MKILIPVIGMHRSGTSAVAGALKHLGIDFGSKGSLMGPAPSNPRGHFESKEVVGIHDSLLSRLGCSWGNVHLRGDWPLTKAADVAIESARNWLSRLNGLGPFGVKDPRMCLFAPVWWRAAHGLVLLRPVIVMRNQQAIARSLARRNQMSGEHVRDLLVPYGKGVLSWWRPDCKVIHFEDLMANPALELNRIWSDLGFGTPHDLGPALDFLDERLVHG